MGDDDVVPVVIDTGGHTMKVGCAVIDSTPHTFPTLVMMGMGGRSDYIGQEAQSRRGILTIRESIGRDGNVFFDDVDLLWHHSFYNELRLAPEEHPVLFSWKAGMSDKVREESVKSGFETWNCPALYMAVDAPLAAFARGLRTALVLDIGHTTSVTAVYEGHSLGYTTCKQGFGGPDLIEYLRDILTTERGYQLTKVGDKEHVREIMEHYCYVALDPSKETASKSTYTLPDDNTIDVTDERFRVPEALFDPARCGFKEQFGLVDLVRTAIDRAPVDEPPWFISPQKKTMLHTLPSEIVDSINQFVPNQTRVKRPLWNSILLSGGGTLFPGLAERLKKELQPLAPSRVSVKIIAPPERRHLVWTGGSIVASLPTFQQMWISKERYDETGPSIVHSHCI